MARLPRWPRSLPWRLAAWHLLVFGGLVLLLAFLELLALRQILIHDATQGLRSDLATLPAQLGPRPSADRLAARAPALLRTLGGPRTPSRIISVAGKVLAQSPAAADFPALPPPAGPTAAAIRSVRGRSFLMVQLVLGPPGHPVGTALVARDLAGVLQPLGPAAAAWAVGTATAMLLALLLALPLTRRALQPLRVLAERAQGIAAGDFGQPLPVPDTADEVARLTAAFNTMSQGLAAAFAKERRTQERMRRFLADASHELRTPLSALNGYLELWRSGRLAAPDRERALEVMEREGNRMAKLVADLLTLSRLDQGLHPAKLPVALAPLAREVCDALLPLAAGRRLTLREEDPGWIAGDSDALRRILFNLLENALRYTPVGGEVTVRIAVGGELSVEDHGPGIDPTEVPRIFERFYRGDPSRSREAGGAGLGLAIVAGLTAQLDGRIQVQSTPGRGTTFTLHFPPLAPPGAS
ncbi:MAG: ATP-binding protein [Thermaerobacter sp.]|nr:ATP-binding protein [Thermaerobacter sp.]